MSRSFRLGKREVGAGQPCYIIAELSCNHEGNFEEAVRLIQAAAAAGADAVKTQAYTADSITRDFGRRPEGTMWSEIDLYRLYQLAHTPPSWQAELQRAASDLGLDFFSSPFDETAVDHLASLQVPAFKIASFELVDHKLLQKVAGQNRPVILSNGMSTWLELEEAVRVLRTHGAQDIALLHCNSGYPAAFEDAHLRTIAVLENWFDTVVGLSDHTLFADPVRCQTPLGHVTPVEAVRLGARIVEVHLTLDREKARQLKEAGTGGFDWAFSREPQELKHLVDSIRQLEATADFVFATEEEESLAKSTHGSVKLEPTERELASRRIRPSLWVVEDVPRGSEFHFASGGAGNVDSLRPAGGLEIRFADFIEGLRAATDLRAGTPLSWDHIEVPGTSSRRKEVRA